MIKYLYISFLLLSFSLNSQAQDIMLKGSVVDGVSLETLRDVHVYTELMSGTYSDIDGNFALLVTLGDSVSFSLLGYNVAGVVISDSAIVQNVIISLKQSTIILEDVEINSLYQANTIIKNQPKQSMSIPGVTYKEKTTSDDYRLGVGGAVMSPATAIYRVFSKSYKEEKRFHEENQVRTEDAVHYKVMKKKMEEVLEMTDRRLDEYYYLDFIHYTGMSLESFGRREIYDLVKLIPNSLDRYYDYLDQKLKETEPIKKP